LLLRLLLRLLLLLLLLSVLPCSKIHEFANLSVFHLIFGWLGLLGPRLHPQIFCNHFNRILQFVQPFNRRRFIVIGLSHNEGNCLCKIFLLNGGFQFFALQVLQVLQMLQVRWQSHFGLDWMAMHYIIIIVFNCFLFCKFDARIYLYVL